MASRPTTKGEKERRAPKPPSTPSRRPEMDDWLNARLYHPLAARLARVLAPTPVSPNLVSVGGGLCIVAAGILYLGLAWPWSALLGFLVHALWHVLDGADGDLARLTGKASPIGELVDGVCDYAGHLLLYVLLAIILFPAIGHWAWPLATVSGFCRIAQANHSESQRRTYLWRVYGVPWLKQTLQADPAAPRQGLFARIFEPFGRLYVALASAQSPMSARIDMLLERASRSDPSRDRGRRVCKEESRLPLRLQTLLGANWRTVGLGLSMAAGSPLWFFLGEIGLGSALLAVSIAIQRRAERRIAERLEANAVMLGA